MAGQQSGMPRKKAVSLLIVVIAAVVFVMALILIFGGVLAFMAGILALIVILGIFYNSPRGKKFLAALRGPKKPKAPKNTYVPPVSQRDPVPPVHTSVQKNYMVLVSTDYASQQRITINKSPFTIGRSPTCSYQLNDPTVGRQHLTITYSEDTGLCSACDNNSTNKTLLNSVVMVPELPYDLHQGDSLQIAGLLFLVEYVHY